ncbi:MAG: SufD family Fe-S cluster assembly protein [Bacilli bacterium]|nr:SufD family Fe-S cluster assembly protein [Bacilli bacterium]
MNKIVIGNGEIKEQTLDKNVTITIEKGILDINQIKIKVEKDTELTFEYTSTEKTKLDIYINIEKNVKCSIYEIKNAGTYKLGYKYYLEENSHLNIYKINDVKEIKELIILNLNGEKAKVNYILKTISKDEEKYDLMVYHNAKNTESNIINNGVNIKDGEIKFNVSGFIPNGIKRCTLNQNNRIINLNNKKCTIKPNLFIDENDVIANHSAHIGKCNEEEIFYLMSRGISKTEAENLLIKGFLIKGINKNKETMENIINKYWR